MTSVSASSPSRAVPFARLAVLGIVFWFLAALTIRLLGPAVFAQQGLALALVFALTVPIAWAFVWAGALTSGARGAAVFPTSALMTSVAMLCDGVAVTFFPALYGLPPATLHLGAAWILWGAGLLQLIAFGWSRRGA